MSATSNNAMGVCIEAYLLNGGGAPAVTYGGNSLTEIGDIADNVPYHKYLYYGIGLPTGSNTVSITFPGGLTYILAASISFTGVSQTGTPDNSATNSGTSTAPTITIAPVASNAFALDCAGLDTLATFTAGSWTMVQSNSGPDQFAYAISYKGPISTSQTNTYTTGASGRWGVNALTMAPSGGAGPATLAPQRLLQGVGL